MWWEEPYQSVPVQLAQVLPHTEHNTTATP
jgi:hypothetical protein